MKILIVYATNSGSTYEVGTIISGVLTPVGHAVVMQKAAESAPANLKKYDAVLFGSPSWKVESLEGQIQETMQEFLERCKWRVPKGLRFAVFGCGDPDFTFFCQAVDTMAQFFKDQGGVLVHEPLKIDSFFFHLEENSKQARQWAEQLAKKL